MRPTMDHAPFAIRVWRIANVIHASIPRTVVRTPHVIDHRRDSVERPPGDRELYDLALNVLNVFMEPRYGAQGELEPVKCFRGQCSSFAARHHIEFAREFLRSIPADGFAIPTITITTWIEQRQRAALELADAESYLDEALTA
jgi:hypothetical protein